MVHVRIVVQSIFSLKRFASQTIRPVVSKLKMLWSVRILRPGYTEGQVPWSGSLARPF